MKLLSTAAAPICLRQLHPQYLVFHTWAFSHYCVHARSWALSKKYIIIIVINIIIIAVECSNLAGLGSGTWRDAACTA